jgi:hypothetical protein
MINENILEECFLKLKAMVEWQACDCGCESYTPASSKDAQLLQLAYRVRLFNEPDIE